MSIHKKTLSTPKSRSSYHTKLIKLTVQLQSGILYSAVYEPCPQHIPAKGRMIRYLSSSCLKTMTFFSKKRVQMAGVKELQLHTWCQEAEKTTAACGHVRAAQKLPYKCISEKSKPQSLLNQSSARCCYQDKTGAVDSSPEEIHVPCLQ